MQHYASTICAMSVCVCVCVSHCYTKVHGEIQMGSPLMGVTNAGGVG